MHHTIKFLTCVLLALLSLAGAAQPGNRIVERRGDLISQNLLFERFYIRDGLPEDRIRTLFQDSRGYLWVGTTNGVGRYDGYQFQPFYKHHPSGQLSGNWITSFCEDRDHAVWVGTREGLNRYNPLSGMFSPVTLAGSESWLGGIITTLHCSEDGRIWIGTPKGMAVMSAGMDRLQVMDKYPFNSPVNKIIRSNAGHLWIMTNAGVIRYRMASGAYEFFPVRFSPNPYGEHSWSLLEDGRDLYIGTAADGLLRLPFDPGKNTYGAVEDLNDYPAERGSLANNQIFDICRAADGAFWLATEHGLFKLEHPGRANAKLSRYRKNDLNNQSLSSDIVYKVLIDASQVLWCGTEHGLNKLDLHLLPFKYYTFTDERSRAQVRGIYSRDGREVWLGTNSGFYAFNFSRGSTRAFSFSDERSFFMPNRSLLADSNRIWLGTLGGALVFEEKTGKYHPVLPGQTVFALLRDRSGNTWIGSNKGLFRLAPNGDSKSFLTQASAAGSTGPRYVRALYEDHQGMIWVGFENGGLGRLNPLNGSFISLSPNHHGERVFGNNIVTILEFPAGVIWAGGESGLNKITISKGLENTDGYRIRNYTSENGLPDKSVSGLIADARGALWISTIRGLARLKVRADVFEYYLPTVNFSASSYQRLNEHQFLFGVYDGFILFDPYQIGSDTVAPKVQISEFKLFTRPVLPGMRINGDAVLDREIGQTRKIVLNYKNNVFSLGFTALHFANPQSNAYAYRLEGFDKDWIYCRAGARSATYTNLDPGTYTFKVRAASSAGRWSPRPAVLQIVILPPPWWTWWAISIYIALAFAAGYWLIRFLHRQATQRNQLHFEQLEKEQLRSLSQVKVKFFTDVAHEFRTPLALIVGPVEDMLHQDDLSAALRYKVRLIYRNCKKLLYLVDELMTFQKLEQGSLKLRPAILDAVGFVRDIYENFVPFSQRKEVNFSFAAQEEKLLLQFDPAKMEMVFNNLIFNAFKFTRPGDSIRITLKILGHEQLPAGISGQGRTGEWLCVRVEDNGTGIAAEEFKHLFERFFSSRNTKGTGVGLSLAISLVELHQGTVTATSVPDVSTCFDVFLPVGLSTAQAELPTSYLTEFDLSVYTDEGVSDLSSDPALAEEAVARLLIVEDEPELRQYLTRIFEPAYSVRTAGNGREALEQIKLDTPDLIISDLMMPEIDGIELCTVIKENISTSHIPFILLTARTTDENKMEGLATGADDYIAKPFNPALLRTKVQQLLDAQRRLIEKYGQPGLAVPRDIARNPLDEALMTKIENFVMAHISEEDLSVVALGSAVAMSRSNLFRKVKAITGQTPIELIYHIRLLRGRELLLERKLNVSEIAYEVGFTNPSSFTKSFKKKFGRTPSDYLNELVERHKG